MRDSRFRLAAGAILRLARLLLYEVWHDVTPPAREGVVYLSMGRAGSNTRALRGVLARRGYPRPRTRRPAFGWGMYFRQDDVLVGGSGQGSGSKKSNRRFTTSHGYGTGSAILGYTIYSSDTLRVYPLVGIGGGGEGLSVKPKGEEEERLAVGTGGPMLRLGWATEYRIKLLPNAGVVFGIHAGWLVALLPIPWLGRGIEGERLGRLRAVRPYFKLTLGGFGSPRG